MRRKIFIAAMAALSLVSCRRDALPGSADASGVIGFSPYMERVSTKASVTDVTTSNLLSFKVMSYLEDTSIVYFTSEVTATKQSSGVYTTSNTYYWPTGSGLDFFAYSGDGAEDKTGDGAIRNTGGVASLTYEVPGEGDEDFVVAKAENCMKASASVVGGMKAQPLTFSHALTKVNSVTLKAMQDGVSNTSNYKFIITDVHIEGAKNRATYTFNPTEGENWGPAEGSVEYAFADTNFTASKGFFLGSGSKTLKCASGGDDQFIILPQTASFSITYAVQYSPDGTDNWAEVMDTTTKTVDVPMVMGKAYDITFALIIDTSPVTFTLSSVDAWTVTKMPAEYWEGDTNYGPGILVYGIVWAPVNCGIGKDSTYPYGLLYQFGRSDGQPADGEPGADEIQFEDGPVAAPEAGKFYKGQKTTISGATMQKTDYLWYEEQFTEWPMTRPSNGIGNPCPEGWRVPTADEMGSLFFTNWNSSKHYGSALRGEFVGSDYYVEGVYFRADRKYRSGINGEMMTEGQSLYLTSPCLFKYNRYLYQSMTMYPLNDMISAQTFAKQADGASVRCVQE